MARILVSGGAGFIGSHLCEALLTKGDEVICVDNFFTGSKRNVAHLQKAYPDSFEVIRHDITEPLRLECDRIYNLACPASPVAYQQNPIKTIKCSTLGMINMLGIANRTGARILQASTSEVYGDPLVHPQTEDYWGNVNPNGPRSCYDEGKRVAESLMVNYHTMNKVDIRIIRIFNTYGPRMAANDGRVVSNFIVQALAGKDITIYGDGSQTRSFCYVSDLVRGMMSLMESESYEGPVNVGNPGEFTIKQLAERVIALTAEATGKPYSSRIVYEPLPKDDPCRRKPDITKAKRLLNWEPKVQLDEGLTKTIAYFESTIIR